MRINIVTRPVWIGQPVQGTNPLDALFVNLLVTVKQSQVFWLLCFIVIVSCGLRGVSVTKSVEEVAVGLFEISDL